MAKDRKPEDLKLPAEQFAVGQAYFSHARAFADAGNTTMRGFFVEAARSYTSAPLISPDFTESEKEIFATLQKGGKRLTKDELLSVLNQDGIERSASQMKNTLWYLTRFGFLTNQKDKFGKGYGLPQWSQS